MNEARISHEFLEKYAEALASDRDEAAEETKRFPEGSTLRRLYQERESSFRLAPAYLSNWSMGNYGQSLADLRKMIPSPRRRKPLTRLPRLWWQVSLLFSRSHRSLGDGRGNHRDRRRLVRRRLLCEQQRVPHACRYHTRHLGGIRTRRVERPCARLWDDRERYLGRRNDVDQSLVDKPRNELRTDPSGALRQHTFQQSSWVCYTNGDT